MSDIVEPTLAGLRDLAECGGADENPSVLRAAIEIITDQGAEIVRLRETYTDDKGTVWSPPTAEAYARTCAALAEKAKEMERVREALTNALAALQPPSVSTDVRAAWEAAIALCVDYVDRQGLPLIAEKLRALQPPASLGAQKDSASTSGEGRCPT